MDTSALVFLVALPSAIASIAAWMNGVRASMYWSLAGLIALGWGMVALAVISGRFTSADLVNWVLLCVLPITAAFFVARSQRLRDRRLVATCVAFVSYLIALLVGINIGTVVGVLKE
jgi:hypothetical protein